MRWILALTLILAFGCQPMENTGPREVEVLAFTATWCSACHQDRPRLVALKARGIKVTKVDVDSHPEIAARWGVVQLPTYVVVVNGRPYHKTHDIEGIYYGLPTPAD